jgi:probable rRNA maturation factor
VRSLYTGRWRVDIDRQTASPRLVSDAELARTVVRALEAAGAPPDGFVGLTLSDDRTLARLNATHLGEDGPTDVLSFPMLPPAAFPAHSGAPPTGTPPSGRQPLGDIVVSVERAIEQAEAGRGGQTGDVRWSPADELRLLVTHGTLHLCGWDHVEPAEEAAMRALEQRLLGGG